MPFNSTPDFQTAARTKLRATLEILVPTPTLRDQWEDLIQDQGLKQSSLSWETANQVLEKLIYTKNGGLSIKNGKCFFNRAFVAKKIEVDLSKMAELLGLSSINLNEENALKEFRTKIARFILILFAEGDFIDHLNEKNKNALKVWKISTQRDTPHISTLQECASTKDVESFIWRLLNAENPSEEAENIEKEAARIKEMHQDLTRDLTNLNNLDKHLSTLNSSFSKVLEADDINNFNEISKNMRKIINLIDPTSQNFIVLAEHAQKSNLNTLILEMYQVHKGFTTYKNNKLQEKFSPIKEELNLKLQKVKENINNLTRENDQLGTKKTEKTGESYYEGNCYDSGYKCKGEGCCSPGWHEETKIVTSYTESEGIKHKQNLDNINSLKSEEKELSSRLKEIEKILSPVTYVKNVEKLKEAIEAFDFNAQVNLYNQHLKGIENVLQPPENSSELAAHNNSNILITEQLKSAYVAPPIGNNNNWDAKPESKEIEEHDREEKEENIEEQDNLKKITLDIHFDRTEFPDHGSGYTLR